MLAAVCEEYAGLFRSGMVEEREGVVRVPPGISVESFRGFLEWLYLGEFLLHSLRVGFCKSCVRSSA